MQKHISRTLWKMNVCLVNTATYLLLIYQFPWNDAWLEFLVRSNVMCNEMQGFEGSRRNHNRENVGSPLN